MCGVVVGGGVDTCGVKGSRGVRWCLGTGSGAAYGGAALRWKDKAGTRVREKAEEEGPYAGVVGRRASGRDKRKKQGGLVFLVVDGR